MADGNFLPEADQDFLAAKELEYELKSEPQPEGKVRHGIIFPKFTLPTNLLAKDTAGQLVRVETVRLLVLVPHGYDETQLDSWYVSPAVYSANGNSIRNTAEMQTLFGEDWQFWSRHLDASEWRPGIDGLESYLQYVRAGLRAE